VLRKHSLPERANESTLPTMIGAVICVRVSAEEQTNNLNLPTQLRAWRSAAAKATKSTNGSTRKAKAPSPLTAVSFRSR
jgi:hypothetical protein